MPTVPMPLRLPHAQRLWCDAEGEHHFVQVGKDRLIRSQLHTIDPPVPDWIDAALYEIDF